MENVHNQISRMFFGRAKQKGRVCTSFLPGIAKSLEEKIPSMIFSLLLVLSTTVWGYSQPVTTNPGTAYALMGPSNSAVVISLADGKIIDSLSVPGNPHGGALTAEGNFLYASSMGSEWISVIDTRTGKLGKKINIEAPSHHAAIGPDNRYVYISAGGLIVIDRETNTISKRIKTPEPSFYPLVSPDGKTLYDLSMGGRLISVVDTETHELIGTIDTGVKAMMGHLAVAPDGKRLYASSDIAGMLTIIDLEHNAVQATVRIENQPHGVAVGADGKRVFVATRTKPGITVIDAKTAKIISRIELKGYPEHLSATADGRYLLAGLKNRFDSDSRTASISIIDSHTLKIISETALWPDVHQILIPRNQNVRL